MSKEKFSKEGQTGMHHEKQNEREKEEGGARHKKDTNPHLSSAQAHLPAKVSKHKTHEPLPDGCHAWGCKSKASQFNFCIEHYDHFKFGLIKKTGEPVSDYEKKLEHYVDLHTKKTQRKVA